MQTAFTIIRKRILIIDDDEDLLEILNDFLRSQGFEVFTSNNADHIFSQIDQWKPDLIVLDYLLKGINGGEICHQVKKSGKANGIPIVLFSAFSKVFLSLGNYGCDLFLAKPFDLDDLLQQISKLINTGSAIPYFGFFPFQKRDSYNYQISN